MIDNTASQRVSLESQVVLLVLSASLPPAAILLAWMWIAGVSIYLHGLVLIAVGALIGNAVARIRGKLVFQTRSLTNLLGAMIHGDYSLRARTPYHEGPTAQLVTLVNDLASTLARGQQTSEESRQLVRKVVEHIDVAIIAFDDSDRVTLVNPAARTLLGGLAPGDPLPPSLGFAGDMHVGESRVVETQAFAHPGRFQARLDQFRQDGMSHSLLFISDIMGILRAEERRVWQNLVRVLSHELNNSLSPIMSISNTLQGQINNTDNVAQGLRVIEDRATSLKQFVQRYRELARLPEPSKAATELGGLVDVVADLFGPGRVEVARSDAITLLIDGDQIKQVLVNLVKNAIEANDEMGRGDRVNIAWQVMPRCVRIRVSDDGPGIANPSNLFIPFYTTKASGSGIGLVLSRQIIEAHGGFLTLDNRTEGGCVATLELPR